MVLLSQMIRSVAITGRTDRFDAWFANRQGGRWAEQTISAAFPAAGPHPRTTPPAAAPPPADPAETRRKLTELHESGVVTDAELERLRALLGF